jgi:hypothetical protein
MRGMERGKGGPGRGKKKKTPHDEAAFPKSGYQQARIDAGITKIQAERWQELAAIPQEKFEEALRDPVLRPTTAGIIVRAAEPKESPPLKRPKIGEPE